MKNFEENNNCSVLIVDDNPKNLQVLGGFLKDEGLSVEFAVDGYSALAWLEKRKFDLVLLDIMMPGMNGFDVCINLKNNPHTADIPVIFITAATDTESIVRGFNVGATDYITKPFVKDELLARVKTQLNAVKSRRHILECLNKIEEQNREIMNSLTYARYIQNAILNRNHDLASIPDHFILNIPKFVLSGDFYWINGIFNYIIFSVMDCTGHGIPGALMSILGTTLLNDIILCRKILQPDEILENLRQKLIIALGQDKEDKRVKDGMEGSVICYNPSSSEVKFAGTHNPLIHFSGNNMNVIKPDKIPIGYYEMPVRFSLHNLQIKEGDMLYMFTDGFMDQFGGPESRKMTSLRFKELLKEYHDMPLETQKAKLYEYLKWWQKDNEQTDDILVVGIRF